MTFVPVSFVQTVSESPHPVVHNPLQDRLFARFLAKPSVLTRAVPVLCATFAMLEASKRPSPSLLTRPLDITQKKT